MDTFLTTKSTYISFVWWHESESYKYANNPCGTMGIFALYRVAVVGIFYIGLAYLARLGYTTIPTPQWIYTRSLQDFLILTQLQIRSDVLLTQDKFIRLRNLFYNSNKKAFRRYYCGAIKNFYYIFIEYKAYQK